MVRVLSCAGDIAALMAPELNRLDREQFVALHLDTKNRLLSREVVSIGHLSAALVHPREVFKAAILANAASVAFVRAGELLGIPVLDHVVVASRGHVSIAERGFG